jgi:hypothetical protein
MTTNNSNAVIEDRARIAAIMESPEGKRSPRAALKLALYSGLSADMALDLLKDLPRETSGFEAAMEREGHIGISSPLGSPSALSPRDQRKAELAQVGTQRGLAQGYISLEQAAARGVKIKGI